MSVASKLPGIEYLSSLAPWSGSFAGEWSLDLTRELLRRLGDPQDTFPSVHVTGTNGKGSVSVAVASILAQAGRKVGLTTSPHLKRINERIVIGGMPISDKLLNQCGERIRAASEGLPAAPTFFEAVTAAAFLAFKESDVDYAVVEVGLGGRLDATNVLKAPKACVVVTIDFDHEQILGNSLEAIAREKAGIIKPGANLVVGDIAPEAFKPIEAASKDAGVAPRRYGIDFSVEAIGHDGARYTGRGDDFSFTPALKGPHQLHNMGVAIAAARTLGASIEDCRRGVENVRWPGRLDIIKWGGRDVIIDAAHNPAGIAALISFLNSRCIRPTCAFGAIDTKNWRGMVESLIPVVGEWVILEPDFPKAVPAHEIVAFLSGFDINARVFGRDYAAFLTAMEQGTTPLLVAGSIYLIGIIRDLMLPEETPLWRS